MIALRPLAQLDPDLVAQNVALVVAAVQEENPHLYLTRGVFAELLAYYNGVLGAQGQANIADYWAARSLAALADDPSADPDLVDDVLSNFRVTRLPGVASAGEVTVAGQRPELPGLGRVHGQGRGGPGRRPGRPPPDEDGRR
jgi:hypothetical protein